MASDTVDAADVAPRHTSVPRRGGTGTSHTQDAGVEMSPMPTWRVVAPMACDTELGGVFFLVPVLGALGIPGEIEANFGIAPELSVWAWLELLARALIRNRDDVLATDPIWSILAWLDRREPGVEFVSAFSEAERYRLPPAFPTPPSGGETLDWELSGDRLRLWHRERFVVVERRVTHPIALRLALDEEGAEAAARGLGIQPLPRGARRTLRRARQCRLLGFQPKPELRRFLEFLLPYVRWRLGASLRLRDSRALTAVMLARRARVECTAAHVDVIMSLERATLPVRLAGLDADPGWVPALGRVVSFHYV